MSITIYKNTETLTDSVFKNPPSEYRGAPFWAWNGDLNKDYLTEQIDCFKKMGLGGAHMHVRTGLAQKYLGDEHMEMIRACTDKFKKEKMLAWLYDEDRWPSGAAGGYVTKDICNRARHLTLSVEDRPLDEFRTLLAVYDVVLDEEGSLVSYRRIEKDEKAAGTKWYAYRDIDRGPDSWYNGQTYVDTLSKKAMKRFIEVTYEAYDKTVGKDFGKTVPAIFTDEPQYSFKRVPAFSTDKNDIIFPWTDTLTKEFIKAYGDDILDFLPEVFWEKQDGVVSVARYHLHDLITELFAAAFGDQCGKWCDEHGIMLTGHMLYEGDLHHQTMSVGETMRSYRGFGLPGIDMLCDAREYSTAKQCQSTVHQMGRCGMLSELYGVTNWDFDFRGHKLQGDWQAALGVTTRVQHLAWYSMEGEAKRDYPASIGYQSPWYEQYKYIEDHFARVNTAMTRGKADVKIGVIHPIESYWLHYGSNDKTSEIRVQMEGNFQNLIDWLLFGTIDFDYICESTLPKLCRKGTSPLKVGEMKYDVIIVPQCETLRSTTLSRLEEFKAAGGRLIFMGDAPTYCDALPSERGLALYNESEKTLFSKAAILKALDNVRDLSIIRTDGVATGNLIYQMRREKNGTRWLFIANGRAYSNIDIPTSQSVYITLRGKCTPTYYDTLTGKIAPIPFRIENGNTVIEKTIWNHDSLLFRLDKYKAGDEKAASVKASVKKAIPVAFPSRVPYTLSEDNVYVLDMAEYKLDNGEWMPAEEILRIDTACRRALGWPRMSGHMVQPWVNPEGAIEHYVTLRYTINSEIDTEPLTLAVEKASQVKVTLNGADVPYTDEGYFADRYIGKRSLPALKKGENVLELVCPLGSRTSVECAYILGNFGVRVIGREKTVTTLPDTLCFADLGAQGLAFYGANVSYSCDIDLKEGGTLSLHAPVYRGALMDVALDGKFVGRIVYSPYTLEIPRVCAGKHTVTITAYGNRFNTFGELHFHHHEAYHWYGPESFRSAGDEWYYEYETKPLGLLRTPVCTLIK